MATKRSTKAKAKNQPSEPPASRYSEEAAPIVEPVEGGHEPADAAELEALAAEAEAMQQLAVEPEAAAPSAGGWAGMELAGVLHLGFAAIAAGRGAHWALQPDEAQALGGRIEAVLDKWFPDGPGAYGPEIALVSTALMIVAPRLQKDAKLAAERARQQQGETETEAGDVAHEA